jgi:hypothetical protein
MAAPCFIAWAADTSAATGPPTGVASSAVSGTAKTILQLKAGAGKIRIIEWGYSLVDVPAAPLRVELVETGTVFATVTTIGTNGVRAYNDATGAPSLVAGQAGTSGTGFNASAEGTITASRLLDYQYEAGIYFKKQFPLGREPEVNASSSLRIRVTPTSAVAVTLMPYIIWEE